jgi:DNA-directed RNA polymerase II subunit RPB1
MTLYKELEYTDDIETIKGVQFRVMSPEMIIDQSVVEITKSDTFERNEPTPNGLFDPRMGVIDHNKLCPVCDQKNNFCPGHFGHIVLAKPVYYIQFFNMVKNTLKCVCFRCSKLLIDPTSDEVKNIINKKIQRQKKWEAIFELITKTKKSKFCGSNNIHGCGAKVPTITKAEGLLKLAMEIKDVDTDNSGEKKTEKQILTAEEVLQIFKRISDVDAEALGFTKGSRPEHLICTVMPVPPPAVRPSVRNDIGQRSEDDLTHKLSMIIKHNNKLSTVLSKKENVSQDQIDMNLMLLQYEVATLIDNTIPGIPLSQQRTGRPIRSLIERLKGKDGRIRGNLMGKRVDFSARSVITPDPNINIDELGVPIKIAMNLTFPEVVNIYNIDKLQELLRNGPDKYPGAKYLRKANEQRTVRLKDANASNMEIKLEIGDVLERHMLDGDYVLFNRQPSLHRSSMMAHKVKVMEYNTFRLNVMVTPSFNADFDGDEMNAHLPQSYQTHEELVQLAAVPSQIISPRESKPIISIVQDIVLGLYRMTKSDVEINKKLFFNLMATNPKCDGVYPIKSSLKDQYSGHEILSTIIPQKINMYKGNSQYDSDKGPDNVKEHFIEIKNGVVKKGCFDKDVYQSRTFGIVHSVYNEYGAEETKNLLDNTQRLICNWLVHSGFSVGISDLLATDESITTFQKVISDMKGNVEEIIKTIHNNTYKNETSKKNFEDFEKKVNDMLNSAVKRVGDAVSNQFDDKSNRMINMIKSRSKGNTINVSQMVGCLGQQNVEGKRIPYGFESRTLPHFPKYDDGPAARGFVQSSFINGLNPSEFFFAAMGGREGLIDTAVNTSETGYIQRKLVKAMEDCKINDDRSVRNANGTIVQFLYGDDGMDSSKIEVQPIPYINDDLHESFYLTQKDLKRVLYPEALKVAKSEKWQVAFDEHYSQLESDKDFIIAKLFNCKIETSVLYPISIARTINIAKGLYDGGVVDVTPKYVLDKIDELCKELYINTNHPGNKLFHMLLRMNLSPKIIIVDHRMCKPCFDYVCDQIRKKYYESVAHTAEMVGVIAAQSIGEPMSQMTLNTFHMSGVSAASKTVRGVPRLKELLSVSKNIKTPVMVLKVKDHIKTDANKCISIMNNIKTVRFKDILVESKIMFDPNDNYNSDIDAISIYKKFKMGESNMPTSPWLIRLEFEKEKMIQYGVQMNLLHQILIKQYGLDTISCMFADDNAEKCIFRIKLVQLNDETDMLTELKALEYNIINNIPIKGVENIENVTILKEENMMFDPITKTKQKGNEWIIYTEGTNLRQMMTNPYIDQYHIYTNDVKEIYDTLGIEAARQALYNEILDVMESINVNYRHISILIDVQTNKGALLSIDRHGINRGDIGPLAKCSFEETTDKLIKAGIFSEYDNINGVSANVILGQIVPAGTGMVDIVVDEDKLQYGASSVNDEEDDDDDDEGRCDMDNFKINFNV